MDLGGGPLVHRGSADILLASFFPDGRHRWSHSLGGSEQDYGRAIAVDDGDNVYITGSFRGTVDLGGASLVSSGGSDMFVAAYTSDGVHRWSRGDGGVGSNRGLGIAVDRAGNLLATGAFTGAFDLGGDTLMGEGMGDVFVASFRSTGEYRWSSAYGGLSWIGGTSIVGDSEGRIYVVGTFDGDAAFDGHVVSSEGEYDVFVLQLYE